MSIITTQGCCDSIVDLDVQDPIIVFQDKDTGEWWHVNCAYAKGHIDEEQLLTLMRG